MTRDFSSIAHAALAVDWVRAASVATVTAIVLFVVLVAIGFTLLFARRRRSAGPGADHARQQKANILLVRLDDAIKSSEDELGFAVAQFGEEKTTSFAAAIAAAKQQLTEAFALQQRLDDPTPDSATQKNEWISRIIHLCETAQTSLDAQQDAVRPDAAPGEERAGEPCRGAPVHRRGRLPARCRGKDRGRPGVGLRGIRHLERRRESRRRTAAARAGERPGGCCRVDPEFPAGRCGGRLDSRGGRRAAARRPSARRDRLSGGDTGHRGPGGGGLARINASQCRRGPGHPRCPCRCRRRRGGGSSRSRSSTG